MKTLFIGRNRIRLDGVGSTNNYAAEMLRQVGTPEGTLITANYQTAGRGQRSNVWQSEAGKNILCTYILKPTWLAIDRQFSLNKAVALAVQRTIQTLCAHDLVSIKWPNDILVNDSKVAGILIENALSGGQIVSSLTGIGMNVNQLHMSVEGRNVCSIADVLKQAVSLEEVQDELSSQLEAVYLRLRNRNDMAIALEFADVLYKRGESCVFETKQGLRNYIVRDVSEQGKLVVADLKGNVIEFQHGEVHMVMK